MEEGTLVRWLVNEGDAVRQGDGVAELESSKIVNTLEAHVAGVVCRKIAKVDDTLPVGALLGVIADAGVADADIDAYIKNFTIESRATISGDAGRSAAAATAAVERDSAAQPAPAPVTPDAIPGHLKQGPDDQDVLAAPHARRLAQKLGINLHNIQGSGRHGRISVADIERAISGAGAVQPPAAAAGIAPAQNINAYTETPLSGARLTIARRLQESKSSIPHYRLLAEARVDALAVLRSDLASRLNQAISLNDMLIKLCATALVKVPECNVQLENNVVKKYRDADIAIAVATDAGLLTPVIRAANTKSIGQIAGESRALIDKARAGKLTLEEITGGTFTISNLGMYGVSRFDAIINPPQCAILAVGRAEPRVVVEEGRPAVATMMTLTLSLDHRVIDGAIGARFLRELARAIEQPRVDEFN
jgi:pyruvate dehydrogenase E2 component (dihydrolipoamide acetyltransferase)